MKLSDSKKENNFDEIFDRVKESLTKIKYGSVTLVVQDGKVIQIESHEKTRIN